MSGSLNPDVAFNRGAKLMSDQHNFAIATLEDIPRLAEIGKVCFASAPEWNAPRFIIERWWKSIILADESDVLVLRSDGRVEAFIIYVDNEEVWNYYEKIGPNSRSVKLLTMLLRPKVLRSRLKKLAKLKLKSTNLQQVSPQDKRDEPVADQGSRAEFFAALMGVDPSFRGRGIGRSMLEACERMACDRGTRLVRIYVDPRNARAQTIYETMGYSHAGRMRNSLMMIKELS